MSIVKIILKSAPLFGILLMAACTKTGSGEQDTGKDGILTFRLEVPPLEVFTRSEEKINENGTTADCFAFYQFSSEDEFERCYTTDYSAMSPAGGGTLVYDLMTGRLHGNKKFVAVRASDAGHLPSLELGDRMQDLLEAKVQSQDGNPDPVCIMSSVSEGGNVWIDVDASGTQDMIKARMPRNIARIDIINNPEETGVEIEKVFVRNARSSGYIAQTGKATSDCHTSAIEFLSDKLGGGGQK